jgi:hypothetical protein
MKIRPRLLLFEGKQRDGEQPNRAQSVHEIFQERMWRRLARVAGAAPIAQSALVSLVFPDFSTIII